MDKQRGNDILFAPRKNADVFEHYKGPFGGDTDSSIRDADPHYKDTPDYWPPAKAQVTGKRGKRER